MKSNFDFLVIEQRYKFGLMSVRIMVILTCNFLVAQTQGERILTSPRVTDWGVWGPWEFCSQGTFVTGMQLYTHQHQGIFRDDRGLTGIRLFCNNFGKKTENQIIKSSVDTKGKWGKTYFCPGIMTGFQLRSEKYQSAFADDTATNNVRMFCDHKEASYLEGDGLSFGRWTEKRLCGRHEVVCGIRTQIDKVLSWDQTGLNNVMTKCCDIPHPTNNCVPKTTWEIVTSCEGFSHQDKHCSYTRRVGISYLEKYSEYAPLHVAEGYGLDKVTSQLQTRFLNTSTDVSYEVLHKDTKEHYWLLSPSNVWESQSLEKAKVTAKRGSRISLYQILGKCGMLQVWGTRMKKVETEIDKKRDMTTFFDFRNENEMEYFSLNLVN